MKDIKSPKIYLLFLTAWLNSFVLTAQVTYSADVKPIIQKHCISCHHPEGPAPFSLESYADVQKRAKFISYVTGQGYMPPWKADSTFQHYRNERILSANEIQQLRKWVETGTMMGSELEEGNGSQRIEIYRKPTVKLEMNAKFEIPSNNKDDFRFFYLPTKIKSEKYITGIEFRPDNKRRVHHSRLMIDTTGTIAGIDGLSEMDTAVYRYQNVALADEFLYGWVPGNFVFRFPKGFGRRLPANSNLILNMHYAPSVLKEEDRSGVHLYLTEKKNISREVKTYILRESNISNQPFEIRANEKPTFYMSSGVLDKDLSFITVQPHAHLLGKSFRAFAITGDGDLIPLVKINDWDFDWQTTYEFKQLIHVPAGSVIVMEGSYDNTSENPRNPYFPPRDAAYGWRTVDEMMNLIFYYVDYKPGDEKLELEYED